jgi:hypothetical protein
MQSLNTLIDRHQEPLIRAAELVALINGDDNANRSLGLELERERLQTLANPSSPESMQALTAHLPVLEALFHRMALDALSCRYPAAKVALMRAALQAQNAYARTTALLSVLKQQQNTSTDSTLKLEVWK